MYNSKTISLKEILWKVFRNPLAAELNYEDAADFTVEAIRLIGAPLSYVNKVTPVLEIQNHKVLLPYDFIYINGIRYIDDPSNLKETSISLTYATDIYHDDKGCNTIENNCHDIDDFTYSIQNSIVFTSKQSGYIQVSYKGLNIDDEGYPLIPDDEKTKMAIEYYILFRFLEPLWLMGKITDKAFEYINQKKLWYMGAAQTSLQLQGMDHLEATMNSINRLIVNSLSHEVGFKGMGKKERLKRYS